MPDARVGILMGSISDRDKMSGAWKVLEELGVPYEVSVASAHRSPDKVAQYARNARSRGLGVIIAGAGGAAHLAGVIAAHTTLPVIGVPMPGGSIGGLDSLLSTANMPPGVPVATVGIGGAKNAGILAAQMLAVSDNELMNKLEEYKRKLENMVSEMNEELGNSFKKP